jgi:hypothetical protein
MKASLIPTNQLIHLGTSPRVETITYEYPDTPSGQRAFISRFEGRWKILREVGRFFSCWYGAFATVDDAAAAIRNELELSLDS